MSLGEFFPEVFKADFARRNLEVGSVLKLYVKDTKPPKEKRFIIVGKNIDGLCLATVYINSEINEKINYSPDPISLFRQREGHILIMTLL
ncbi:MAG: hypothetical protein ACOYOE_07735 [Chlorobium sp.]